MSRNPDTCPHNITETDLTTNEEFCVECGDVVELAPDEDALDNE